MGVLQWIKRILKGTEEEKITDDSRRYEANRIDTKRYESIQSDMNRIESYDTSIRIDESEQSYKFISNNIEDKRSITLEKESLQVGVAAGFISRSLIDIEDSLKRIEAQMTTRDWFTINILPKIEQLNQMLQQTKEIISKHDIEEEKRFEILYGAIMNLKSLGYTLPEPIRHDIEKTIQDLKKVALSPKMEEILQIVKERGEISYAELAQKVNVSIDSLRGILSKMCKITDEIERFEREGKGWIRYKSIHRDMNRYESIRELREAMSSENKPLEW